MQGKLSLTTDQQLALAIIVAMKLIADGDSSLRETSVVLLRTQANTTTWGSKIVPSVRRTKRDSSTSKRC